METNKEKCERIAKAVEYRGGRCTSIVEVVKILEGIPEKLPLKAREEILGKDYEALVNTVRYAFSRMTAVEPKYHKGKSSSVYDYHTCGGCGRIVQVTERYCKGCGRRIGWDSPACLTGINP